MQTVCKQCRPEHHDVTRHTLMRIILSPQVHHFPHAQIRRTILNELFPVLTEGDTFTDLDGHVGLVNVLIDSLLKKYVFPLCNREVSLISILFIRIFFFLPSSKTNATLSVPRTKRQDNVVMLQRDPCQVHLYKTNCFRIHFSK